MKHIYKTILTGEVGTAMIQTENQWVSYSIKQEQKRHVSRRYFIQCEDCASWLAEEDVLVGNRE